MASTKEGKLKLKTPHPGSNFSLQETSGNLLRLRWWRLISRPIRKVGSIRSAEVRGARSRSREAARDADLLSRFGGGGEIFLPQKWIFLRSQMGRKWTQEPEKWPFGTEDLEEGAIKWIWTCKVPVKWPATCRCRLPSKTGKASKSRKFPPRARRAQVADSKSHLPLAFPPSFLDRLAQFLFSSTHHTCHLFFSVHSIIYEMSKTVVIYYFFVFLLFLLYKKCFETSDQMKNPKYIF